MTINISEIKYEETFVGLYGDFTHYFIAPKELVKNSHPDCEHATISVEPDGCGGYTCMISPTAERRMIMAKCTGRRCPMQIGYKVNECNHKDCPYRTEPITNADSIRSMSDEELAAWIVSMTTVCECCAEINECESPKCFNKCLHGVEDWLQQPPKGGC